LGTYLKSFRNAPQWSNDELKIFQKCFNNVGLIINKLPSKKIIKYYAPNKICYEYYLKLFNL
jgi:hypothetical protein